MAPASTHSGPISSAKALPYVNSNTCQTDQRRKWRVGGYLWLRQCGGIHLASNKMNGKLITGLNNCPSVSPTGLASHSICCPAGPGEEGSSKKQTKGSTAKTEDTLEGWRVRPGADFFPGCPGQLRMELGQVRPAPPPLGLSPGCGGVSQTRAALWTGGLPDLSGQQDHEFCSLLRAHQLREAQ